MELIIIVGIMAIFLLGINKNKLDEYSRDNGAWYVSEKPLTTVEQIAYWRIREAVEPEKVLLAQVSFSRFLKSEGFEKKSRNSKFYRSRQKVADFVICNKDFSIHVVIEIDDSSHNKEKDEARDKMLEEAGIKTIRFEAKNLPSTETIRKVVNNV